MYRTTSFPTWLEQYARVGVVAKVFFGVAGVASTLGRRTAILGR
jgi:hypothetical protein